MNRRICQKRMSLSISVWMAMIGALTVFLLQPPVWGQEGGKKSQEAEKPLSSPNQAQVVELNAAERSDLELTVYQQGLSLVKDLRRMAPGWERCD